MAQRVDDKNGNIPELRDDRGRHVVAIAEVCCQLAPRAAENVTVNDHLAVGHLGGSDFDIAHGKSRRDLPGIRPHVVAVGVLSVESVIEHAPEVGHGVR